MALVPSQTTVAEHLPTEETEKEKAEEHKSEEHKSEEHKSESSGKVAASSDAKLLISTEPVSAKVLVDSIEVGGTPIAIKLGDKAKKIELVAEGFENYSKSAPAIGELEEGSTQLAWKVELRAKKGALKESPRASPKEVKEKPAKAKPEPVKEKQEPVKVTKKMPSPSKEVFAEGVVGPWFVQVRSLPNETKEDILQAKNQIEEYRGQLKEATRGCSVDLGSKGKWIRVIVGPYAKKEFAKTKSRELQGMFSEPLIVTGAQSCLSTK